MSRKYVWGKAISHSVNWGNINAATFNTVCYSAEVNIKGIS